MSFMENPTRFLFFTGKGGVGKTALACATSLRLADAGKMTLLVSTDPASNLDQMLGAALTNAPSPIPGAQGLFAMNLDPERAADDYRERVIAPYRAIWSDAKIHRLEEQLAGACTTEIAAFDEFTALLAGTGEQSWSHVIFDTAPTGHTLRLLSLPRAWTRFLEDSPHSESCLGPHSGLKMQETRFAHGSDPHDRRPRHAPRAVRCARGREDVGRAPRAGHPQPGARDQRHLRGARPRRPDRDGARTAGACGAR